MLTRLTTDSHRAKGRDDLFALCGSYGFLAGLANAVEAFGLPSRKVYPLGATGVVGQIWYAKRDSVRLARHMYADGGPCLTRKRERLVA